MIDRLVTRADGVPVHIEELSKTLLERPMPAQEAAFPATLKASMMARLDQLGDAKQIAQVGSVIGREFSHQLVIAVSSLPEEDTAAALVRMVGSGLFYQRGTGPAATYEFKHGLVQEAAYDSLLKRRRQQLHGQIATVLEERVPEAVETEPELLALHWEQGQRIEKALDYRLRAARRADKLCAPWEAVTHYLRALELTGQLADTPGTRRAFLDTLLPLIFVRGEFWRNAAAEEQARRYVEKGLAVAREFGDASAIARLGAFAGAFWIEEQLLEDSLAQAEASGDDATRAEVATRHSGYLGFAGRYEQSLAHTKRAIQIFEQLGNRVELGFALVAPARCWSARAGLLEQSLRFTEAARRIVSETGNAAVRSWLPMEAETLMYQGSWQRAVQVAEEGLPAAWEIGNWFVVQFASAWAAIAYLKLGRVDDARRIVDEAVKIAPQGVSDNAAPSYLQTAVGQVLVAEGKFAEAYRIAQAAIDDLERSGNRLEQGFAYRTLGQAYAADGRTAEAEASFRQSLEIFGEIESQPELAQTLLAYGRFQRDRNPEEGIRLLKRSLALFEAIGARGWVEEAEAALQAPSPEKAA
jgi:tetratricopeptide (TPR) repeat protein